MKQLLNSNTPIKILGHEHGSINLGLYSRLDPIIGLVYEVLNNSTKDHSSYFDRLLYRSDSFLDARDYLNSLL